MVGTVGSGSIPLKTAPWEPAKPSQSVFCRAVRPCDVASQVYPVNVQNSIYTFDSMNDRFGFAMVT